MMHSKDSLPESSHLLTRQPRMHIKTPVRATLFLSSSSEKTTIKDQESSLHTQKNFQAMNQLPTNQSEAVQPRQDIHSPQDVQNIQNIPSPHGIQGIQNLQMDGVNFYSNDALLSSMQQSFESQFITPSSHVPEARDPYSVQSTANHSSGSLNLGPSNDISLPGIFPNIFQTTTAEPLPVMASASSFAAFEQLVGDLSQFSLPLQFPTSFLDFSMSDNALMLQTQQSQYTFLQPTQEETQFISLQQIQEPQQQLDTYQNFFTPSSYIQEPQQQSGLRLQEFQPLQYPPTNFLPIPVDFSRFLSPGIDSPGGTKSTFSDQTLFGVDESDSSFSSAAANELQSMPFDELSISSAPCTSGDIVRRMTIPIGHTQVHIPQVPVDQGDISSSSMNNNPLPPGKQECSTHSNGSDYSGRKVKKAASKPNGKKRGIQKKKKETVKPDDPRLQLKCDYMDCPIICSSYPSLARHADGHRWRGSYSPVRCESCHSSLSNEFSVQRHILRSIQGSKCRKWSIYSIMKSATEVDYIVKFTPNMPHGKKTARLTPEAFSKFVADD